MIFDYRYVAIIGSREYPEPDRVHAYVQRLPSNSVIVSGQARGVDSEARRAALEHGLNVVDVPAIWRHHGRGAGMKRNRIIIDLAERVVAFWDMSSRGTLHGMRLAESAGVPVTVFGPDGKTVPAANWIASS